jgi:hypothetical protein
LDQKKEKANAWNCFGRDLDFGTVGFVTALVA